MRKGQTTGGIMGSRGLGIVLLIVGVVIALVCALADSIGLGGYPGFGWKQIVGVIVGVVIAVWGLVQMRGGEAPEA